MGIGSVENATVNDEATTPFGQFDYRFIFRYQILFLSVI